ncbi:MAG TPA: acetyl-CoA C-acetyltransferase [Dongiaceae bacterium]|nr:acetyl-CoA C-acetyltransferase [Dongiaceae bacterium]
MSEILLAAPVRTPIGSFGGALATLTAAELGGLAGAECLRRARVEPAAVDYTVFGNARQAGGGPNPARQVGRRAGLRDESPAYTINMACASGLQAILSASQTIRDGDAEIVLAGGTESMSRVPYMLERARWGYRLGHGELTDGMYRDGFLCPLSGKIMGETAETLAIRDHISRAEQDAYAAESQQRCQRARKAGLFQDEILPVTVSTGRKTTVVDADEHPRDGVTVESLAKLPPVFQKDGTVHAGNSSGITDGAAAVLVLSAETARRTGIEPWARIVGWASAGVDPAIMGIGPVPAVRKLEQRTGVRLADIDLVELNEAFAAQVLACDRELHFDRARLNVNGGAIALGHPIGCTGTRIVVTLLHEMRRRGARRGLATLCVSGGLGFALLLERV